MNQDAPGRPTRAERRESLRQRGLVVKPHRPGLARAGMVLAVVLSLAALAAVFEGGRRVGADEWQQGARTLARLQHEARRLSAENETLRRQVAALRTSRAVADEAGEEVRRMLVELESEIQRQREQLDFYRTIVSPEDGVAGLRIQDFTVVSAAQAGLYRMQLVLVQAAKHDKPVSGVVSFSLEGANAGQPVRFAASELAPSAGDEAPSLGFSFRYFKDLEQDILLPEGFVPDRVVVEVSPEGEPERVIRQSFDWSVKS